MMATKTGEINNTINDKARPKRKFQEIKFYKKCISPIKEGTTIIF